MCMGGLVEITSINYSTQSSKNITIVYLERVLHLLHLGLLVLNNYWILEITPVNF